jgi:DNA-directed RNA polymerase subunit RPC12/RpoP
MTELEGLPIVQCPRCKEALVVAERPVPHAQGLVRVVYRCKSCATETMRTIKHAIGGRSEMHNRAMSG